MSDEYARWSMEAFKEPWQPEPRHLLLSNYIPQCDNSGEPFSADRLRLVYRALDVVAGGSTKHSANGSWINGDFLTQSEPVAQIDTVVPLHPWIREFAQEFHDWLEKYLDQELTRGHFIPAWVVTSSRNAESPLMNLGHPSMDMAASYIQYAMAHTNNVHALAAWLAEPAQTGMLTTLTRQLQSEIDALSWPGGHNVPTKVAKVTLDGLWSLTAELFAPSKSEEERMALARGDITGPLEPEDRFWLYANFHWFSGWSIEDLVFRFGKPAEKEVEPSLRLAKRVVQIAWLSRLPRTLAIVDVTAPTIGLIGLDSAASV